MKKRQVLVLGATGMLGSMLVEVLSKQEQIILHATIRNATSLRTMHEKYPDVYFHLFDAESDSISSLLKKFESLDWIINAIGIIKPFIHDDNPDEVERAIAINALFPHYLAKQNTNVIQIATDCVFSGAQGNYVESDIHDALDVYGKTKSLGEAYGKSIHHLRCSIIGPEIGQGRSLLEWVRKQPERAHLNGFSNHFWNGITTYHFAKICEGIIIHDLSLGHIQHIVPANRVSKMELLSLIADAYDREDLSIRPVIASQKIDRTLSTSYDTMNRKLWQAAGYKTPLRIDEMLGELSKI